MMIFRILSEVIEVKEPGSEKTIIHHPMKYDFEDYRADVNTSNYMVSKHFSPKHRTVPFHAFIVFEFLPKSWKQKLSGVFHRATLL